MQFEQKTLSEIQWNPFDMIGKQWYLLTAGGLSDYNTMTASWGKCGESRLSSVVFGRIDILFRLWSRTTVSVYHFLRNPSVQRCSSVAHIPAEIATRQRKQG